ncbi:hypothetical protein GCM10011507_30020 [Edaphobacter acidisoli]|uniref:HTH cro/C1-type domain-containing protein n=1 Tax=Edaphobacter acidisoli TaxID=2040573 RepID=A0A916S199_9BACT|nr:helix-turn-helix domain-containing protein [Edaphobacter acidisoli]GGA76652.1 hypothetical protein GCM10011507_30020 [Edaphobacter acidisoli]
MPRPMSASERKHARELGAWLARKRLALSLTQIEFARMFGVGEDAVSRWENGKARISHYTVHRVKEMLRDEGLSV